MHNRRYCIQNLIQTSRLAALAAIGLGVSPLFGASSVDGERVVRLPALRVVASADASADGLRPAYAGGQVASGARVGLLGSLNFIEAPFSQTAYTQELIRAQQAPSIGEVLLNDSAVRVARGFGNFQQLYLVRGLPVYSDDMTYNGLYGLLPRQYLAAELVERVEVLRGANALLNGAAPGGSGLGGAVNVMPKRATNADLNQLTAGIQTGGQRYGAADIGRRFADDSIGLRLNLAARDGASAVDGEEVELALAALGFDYRLGALRLSADVGHQDHKKSASQPSVTIKAGVPLLSTPDASESIAQPWTYSNERDTFGTLRGEFDFSKTVTVWLAAGVRESHEAATFANPTVINSAGDTTSYRFNNVREDSIRTGEIGLRMKLQTGPLKHTWSATATAFRSRSKNAYAFSNFSGFTNNLYAPTPVVAPLANYYTGGLFASPHMTEEIETDSIALADVMALADGSWQLVAGVRRQKIENASFDYNTGARSSLYSKNAVTPAIGLLHRATRKISLYGNMIEGLTKGDIAPAVSGGVAVANVGEVLSPYKTKQYEVGVKYDGRRIGGALGVFRSEKPSAGVDASGNFRRLYQQRNEGVELSAFGLVSDTVKVLGGASLLRTETSTGKDAIGAPPVQGNLGVEWQASFVKGLSFDARVLATGTQYADAANTQKLPSWERFDVGARHVWRLAEGRQLTTRLRLENAFGEDYWASAGGYPGAGYLTVGAPRTFVVSCSLEF